MTARALVAGPGALRALRPGRTGAVELVLSGGAYVRTGDDWMLLADPDAPFGPLSVGVAGPWRRALRPGQLVQVEPGRLWLGGQVVGLERLRERRPVPRPCRAAAAAAAEAVAAALAVTGGPPEDLVPGLRALRCRRTREGVRRLAGLGEGLTPAGDDVLAGYAAWRHATGAPAQLSALAAGRGSSLGHAYLRCAERGELPEAGAAVLAAVIAGEPKAAGTAAIALHDWGASSGAAMLWGIAAGAEDDPLTRARLECCKEQQWPAQRTNLAVHARRVDGHDLRHALACTTARVDGLRAGDVVTLARQRGVAQPGSAFALGAKGRRFESGRPDETSALERLDHVL
jgi:Protein of unknown function (DUF2877)